MELTLPVASWHPNAVQPAEGRVLSYAPPEEDECVASYLDRMGWDAAIDAPSKVYLNDRLLTREEWLSTSFTQEDRLHAHAALAGDDSDLGRIILTIAVLVLAAQTGGLAAAAYGPAAGGLASAAVSIGGMMLINAIAPLPTNEDKSQKDDPTYSVSGGSNSVRPFDSLLLICGAHRVYPDIDEKPLTWYEGEDQFLSQTFNFGIGKLRFNAPRIGETALESMTITSHDLKTDVTNVDSEPGNILKFSTGWVLRSGPVDTVEISLDVGGVLVAYDEEGTPVNQFVEFAVEKSPYGAATWTSVSFPSLTTGYTMDNFEEVLVPDPHNPGSPPAGAGWVLSQGSVLGWGV